MSLRDQVLAVTREILGAFEREEIPAALSQLFLHRHGDIPSLRWSWRNRLIASLQGHLDARGFRQWQEVGRWVRRGEHAFYILGPVARRAKEADPERGIEEGDLVVRGFKAIPIFGYDQTEGEPLPMSVDEAAFLDKLPLVEVARSWGLEVGLYDIRLRPRAAGFYRSGNQIGLGVENLATWMHEFLHYAADDRLGTFKTSDRPSREIVAELGGAVLLECIGERSASDRGGAYRYLSHYCQETGADLLTACTALIDRTCACVALILDTAEQLAGVPAALTLPPSMAGVEDTAAG